MTAGSWQERLTGDSPLRLDWDPALEGAWRRWLAPHENKVHLDHGLPEGPLSQHVERCFDAATTVARRALDAVGIEELQGAPTILDHGASAGFNSFALQTAFPQARVVGLDPDGLAIGVANAMSTRLRTEDGSNRPRFVRGAGESLPFRDATFDLVVSVTVIEHVRDVDRCLAELARVLRPGGSAYIETPNYAWPLEPHLGVLVPPVGSKRVLRWFARAQGKGDHLGYLEHLNLVRPGTLEAAMRRAGLSWRNLAAEKLGRVLAGDTEDVVAYERAGRLLAAVGRSPIGRPLSRWLLSSGLYPSLMYAARRRSADAD